MLGFANRLGRPDQTSEGVEIASFAGFDVLADIRLNCQALNAKKIKIITNCLSHLLGKDLCIFYKNVLYQYLSLLSFGSFFICK